METKSTKYISETECPVDTNDTTSNNRPSTENFINPQVKAIPPKTGKRRFSRSDKLQFIQSFEACTDNLERGTFLRKNGLYYSSISKWKKALNDKAKHCADSKAYKALLANQQLQRENTRLKKQLSQAEAIIDLQKKISALLSLSDLDQEASEIQS
ncbi:MAG: hypothetical protein A3H43_03755 [Gammaproteobacteria bacterium RIFCSPLOWO2_02_FULL_42_9]|nr:MAG: hypothetical protein A3H43_03755 [Gammaproteobacteria bacterium RIFCSPLOWO2_02_FULL_42_9]